MARRKRKQPASRRTTWIALGVGGIVAVAALFALLWSDDGIALDGALP